MDTVLVFICHGQQWVEEQEGLSYRKVEQDVIEVPRDATYNVLVDAVRSAIPEATEGYSVSLSWASECLVNRFSGPVRVRNDRDVRCYLRIISDTTKALQHPLCVELVPVQRVFVSDSASNQPHTQAHAGTRREAPLDDKAADEPAHEPPVEPGLQTRSSHHSGLVFTAGHEGIDRGSEPAVPSQPQYDSWRDFDTVRTPPDDDIPVDFGVDDLDQNEPCDYHESPEHVQQPQSEGNVTAAAPPRVVPLASVHNTSSQSYGWNDVGPSSFGLPRDDSSYRTDPSTSMGVSSQLIVSAAGGTPVDITVGQLYTTKAVLKHTLSIFAIQNRFEFKTKRSTRDRLEVVCVDDNCKWRLRATTINNSDWFKIRVYHGVHSCNFSVVHRDHRQATSELIGELYRCKYSWSGRSYRPGDIRHDIELDHGITVSYDKAWKAREKCLESIWGSAEDSYSMLPAYCHELESKNPGTVTHILTDESNRFKYFFMALGPCIRGFLACIRPVVAVDATHLKHKYRGQLLIASCMDANSQIYPLAFGVVPSETDGSYSWFFERLRDVIGDPPELVFISDRHRSIQRALSTVYPSVPHGLCIHHLGLNLQHKNFRPKDVVMPAFYKGAKAYTVQEFNECMQDIESVNPRAAQYVREADPSRWARSHFPGRRYSMMTTNISESLNNVFREARCRPLVPMLDYIRETLQRWFHERRTVAANMPGPMTKEIEDDLKNKRDEALRLHVTDVNVHEFRVTGTHVDAIVNLHTKTCTCREFDLDQYPCVHAFAACRYTSISPYDVCSRFYTAETLVSAYAESIYPVGRREMWETPDEVRRRVVRPPMQASRPAGRPRKERVPSQGEEVVRRRCSRCKQLGHNRSTCKNPIPLHPTQSEP